jgi:hypothetical protein
MTDHKTGQSDAVLGIFFFSFNKIVIECLLRARSCSLHWEIAMKKQARGFL